MIPIKEYEKSIIKNCFLSDDFFQFCLEKIPVEDDFWTEKENTFFWSAFKAVSSSAQKLTYASLSFVLKNQDIITDFKEIISSLWSDESYPKEQLNSLIIQHHRRILYNISRKIDDNIIDENPEMIANEVISSLFQIVSADIKPKQFGSASMQTFEQIRKIQSGEIEMFLDTGNLAFDDLLCLTEKRLILMAAAKKIGKSRFLIFLANKLVDLNDAIAIQWYSFEMNSDELVRCFISYHTGISESRLMGKGARLTGTEMTAIENSLILMKSYPIEFIDESSTVYQIQGKFENFVKKNKGKKCLCFVDNFGLIKPGITGNDNANDDDISRNLKSMRDSTGGTIIVLHHLTKESESKWNKEEGYEPKVGNVRGSSRIVDYANQVILLHRPDHYKDLVAEAKASGRLKEIQNLFIVEIALNRHGAAGKVFFEHKLEFCQFKEYPDQTT